MVKNQMTSEGNVSLGKNTQISRVKTDKEHQVLDKNRQVEVSSKKDIRLVRIVKIIYNYCHPSFCWNNSGKNPSRTKPKKKHRYRRSDNQLFVLSDDQAPRWMRGFLEIFQRSDRWHVDVDLKGLIEVRTQKTLAGLRRRWIYTTQSYGKFILYAMYH